MDKKVLKEKLATVVEQIKTNSKDAHFANKLIDDLLSLKGQLDIEPTELDCGKKVNELKGDTYRITLTDRGILYHEYGGYNIFVTPNIGAIYQTLADMVVNQEENAKLEGEAKENLDLLMSSVGWVLQAPKIALSDAQLTIDIATMVIKNINERYEELSKQELQAETIEEDEEFRQAALAMEEFKKEAK